MRLLGKGFDAGVIYAVSAAAAGSQFFSAQETAASDGTFIVTIHDFPVDLAPGDAIDVTATAGSDPAAEVAGYRFHMMGPSVEAGERKDTSGTTTGLVRQSTYRGAASFLAPK
jgi:hypothetical protein